MAESSSSSPPVRIGVIGLGLMGQYCHLANFATLPGCEVTGVCDLREGVAEMVARRWNVGAFYRSHREMLRTGAVDAVVVATRRDATGPIVRDCLDAGVHVLSEKPMALTAADARRLAELADERGVVYAIGYMKRHDPGFRTMRDLIASALSRKSYGELLYVRGHNHCAWYPFAPDGVLGAGVGAPIELEVWPPAPDWVPKACLEAYGWFVNVQIHQLNLLRGLTPGPLRVLRADCEDKRAMVELNTGEAPISLNATRGGCGRWREGLEFLFSKARVAIDFPSPLDAGAVARVVLETADGERREWPDHGRWAFREQAAAFIGDVAAGGRPIVSGADAVEDMLLCEEIWRVFLDAGKP